MSVFLNRRDGYLVSSFCKKTSAIATKPCEIFFTRTVSWKVVLNPGVVEKHWLVWHMDRSNNSVTVFLVEWEIIYTSGIVVNKQQKDIIILNFYSGLSWRTVINCPIKKTCSNAHFFCFYFWRWYTRVNFNNILHAAFSYESFAQSFFCAWSQD